MARTNILSTPEFITKFKQLKRDNQPLEVLTAELFPAIAKRGYVKFNPNATKEDIEEFNKTTLNKIYAKYGTIKRNLKSNMEKLEDKTDPKSVKMYKKLEVVLESIDGLVQREGSHSSRGEDLLALVDGLVMDDEVEDENEDNPV